MHVKIVCISTFNMYHICVNIVLFKLRFHYKKFQKGILFSTFNDFLFLDKGIHDRDMEWLTSSDGKLI